MDPTCGSPYKAGSYFHCQMSCLPALSPWLGIVAQGDHPSTWWQIDYIFFYSRRGNSSSWSESTYILLTFFAHEVLESTTIRGYTEVLLHWNRQDSISCGIKNTLNTTLSDQLWEYYGPNVAVLPKFMYWNPVLSLVVFEDRASKEVIKMK